MIFLNDLKKEYRSAKPLELLLRKKSEYIWYIHSYVDRGYIYGVKRILLRLVRIRQVFEDGSSYIHTVLPSFLFPYHLTGAHEILSILDFQQSEKEREKEPNLPEVDKTVSMVSASLVDYI